VDCKGIIEQVGVFSRYALQARFRLFHQRYIMPVQPSRLR
jgi:hypothetical protein